MGLPPLDDALVGRLYRRARADRWSLALDRWASALQAEGSLRVLEGDPPLAALPYAFQYRRDDARPLVSKLRVEVQAAVDFAAPCRIP